MRLIRVSKMSIRIKSKALVLVISTLLAGAVGQTEDALSTDQAGVSQHLDSQDQHIPDCHPLRMSKCTDPLKVVTDNRDLGFATSMNELQKMCPKLMEGLRCIDDFTIKCLDREHRAYFNTLYAGTTNVIVDLCQEGAYQSAYLRHAPCMRAVQSGYEQCAAEYQDRIKSLNPPSYDDSGAGGGDYGGAHYDYEYVEENYADEEDVERRRRRRRQAAADSHFGMEEGRREEYYDDEGLQGEEESVRLLCCSFQKYLHCSETVVNATCGHDTAQFTKSFLDRMSGPLIQGHCQSYEYGSDGCTVTSSQPRSDWDDPHGSSPRHQSGSGVANSALTLSVLLPMTLLLTCFL